MNNNLSEANDFDLELKRLLENIENIKVDVDLYGVLVEEKMLIESI